MAESASPRRASSKTASATPKTRAKTNGAPRKPPTPRRAASGPIAKRLEGLREVAVTDPRRAQRETWAWIQELGQARDSAGLEELFSLGTPAPKDLDGPTDGILVTSFINPVADLPIRLLTRAWMPWMGKRFDAASRTGINRMTSSSRWVSKLLWPLYSMREAPDERLAFEFETGVEPGRIDPAVDVLKIDYEPVTSNPRLGIRQIRDELVELVPDTYLGRILFKLRGRYSNIGYFALRQPAS
jgi:hypothetical protein